MVTDTGMVTMVTIVMDMLHIFIQLILLVMAHSSLQDLEKKEVFQETDRREQPPCFKQLDHLNHPILIPIHRTQIVALYHHRDLLPAIHLVARQVRNRLRLPGHLAEDALLKEDKL